MLLLACHLVALSGCASSIHTSQGKTDLTEENNTTSPADPADEGSTKCGADLIPGLGFSGPTQEPGPIGQGPGSDAKVIARWDVVPHQDITGDFEIGVVAFHINGVDRIDMAVEGGNWTPLTSTCKNPRTGVAEYWGRLRISDFAQDGPVEIRAIAYPFVGVPRLLPSLVIHVNGQQTLPSNEVFVAGSTGDDLLGDGTRGNPFQTIATGIAAAGNGGIVTVIEAGTYEVAGQASAINNSRWITVRSEPGVFDVNDVVIAYGTPTLVRPNVARLKWKKISFDFSNITTYYPESSDEVWFDTVSWTDPYGWEHGRTQVQVRVNRSIGASYATDSTAIQMLYGFAHMTFGRNIIMNNLTGDALTNTEVVINATINGMDGHKAPGGIHPDVSQMFGEWENIIRYGVFAWGIDHVQGLFHDHDNTSITNFAYVNYIVDNSNADPPISQLNSAHEHVLFQNVSIVQQNFMFRDDKPDGDPKKFTAHNVLFANSTFDRLERANFASGLPAGVTVKHGHFVHGELHGDMPTTGELNVIVDDTFEFSGDGRLELLCSGVHSVGAYEHPNDGRETCSDNLPNRGAHPW